MATDMSGGASDGFVDTSKMGTIEVSCTSYGRLFVRRVGIKQYDGSYRIFESNEIDLTSQKVIEALNKEGWFKKEDKGL